jgi:OpgC protein
MSYGARRFDRRFSHRVRRRHRRERERLREAAPASRPSAMRGPARVLASVSASAVHPRQSGRGAGQCSNFGTKSRAKNMMTIRTTLPPRGRDYRLDFLRGFTNWGIYLDHIPNNAVNWLISATMDSATPIALTRTLAKADALLAHGAAAVIATAEQAVRSDVGMPRPPGQHLDRKRRRRQPK